MGITGFVILRRAPHQPGRQRLGVQLARQVPGHDLLDQVQKRAPVAIGHFQQRLARGPAQRQRPVQRALGALGKPLQIAQAQPFQHQHLGAAQ